MGCAGPMRSAGVLVAALAVCVGGRAAAQGRQAAEAGPPPRWAEFTAALDAYAREDSVVGASVIVLRAGRPVARHDLGLGDRERRLPPDPEAEYHWASITKTLTAVAVMQLRDRDGSPWTIRSPATSRSCGRSTIPSARWMP